MANKKYEPSFFQYKGCLVDDNGNYIIPDWAIGAYKMGLIYYDNNNQLYVKTNGYYSVKVDIGDTVNKIENLFVIKAS